VHTFVVRIAPAEHPDEAWRGVVRRVADGHEQTFHGVEQLLDLMRAVPEAPTDRGAP
jgi:hypothetical protein